MEKDNLLSELIYEYYESRILLACIGMGISYGRFHKSALRLGWLGIRFRLL